LNRTYSLADLGWAADFLRQLALDEIGTATPCRISAVHRDRLETLSEAGPLSLTLPPGHSTAGIAVGDWVSWPTARACCGCWTAAPALPAARQAPAPGGS